ncbi:MAG: amidohydrolase family protein [Rhodospirillales bacterium]|nr:amidohydrolase family protein [Rhodospirillales bacterium]
MDLILRRARLPEAAADAPPVDIGVQDGRIVAIAPDLAAEGPAYDAGGRLVCGGLIETHIHLDKSCIIDRCAPAPGREARAVARVSAVKHTFTVEDVIARASRTLEKCISHGTTRMRTHVEVDPGVGLRGFEGVKAAAAAYGWAIDVEICVFPQEGLTNNPGTEELLVAALRNGARVIGAAPGYDTDHPGQIRRIFALAREYGVDIDMHLDFGNAPTDLDIGLVCELTEEYRLGGRVAVGHMTKLSTLPPDELRDWGRRLADAGVAVTILPATDLFLMGRDQTHNVRRGVVDANLLDEAGVTCSISTNNVLNPFTPFGDCSLLRMANLHANILQVGERERLGACFDMLTTRSARLLNLRDYGVAVGNPADLAVIDATSPQQAVAEIAHPLAVFKRGRRSVTRHAAELHPPR